MLHPQQASPHFHPTSGETEAHRRRYLDALGAHRFQYQRGPDGLRDGLDLLAAGDAATSGSSANSKIPGHLPVRHSKASGLGLAVFIGGDL